MSDGPGASSVLRAVAARRVGWPARSSSSTPSSPSCRWYGSGATAFKSQSDAIAYPPKVFFTPTLEGFVDLFTVQTHQPHDFIAKLPPPTTWYEKIARDRDMVIAGPSRVRRAVPQFADHRLRLDHSRDFPRHAGGLWRSRAFKVPLADDLLFFILSTRMMPPIAVAVPIYMMYRYLGLYDTRIGMILLVHGGECVARGLAAQGLHRRDPARIRGGGADRRLHAAAGVPKGRAAAGGRPASRRPRSSA